ncbi:MAG: PAS domain S-box protein [Candidatus Omnitrophota bacterium]
MSKVPWRPTIGAKLTAWFLFMTLVPLSAVVYLAYDTAKNQLREEIVDKMVIMAEDRASDIEQYVSVKEQSLKLMATRPTIMAALEDFHRIFRESGLGSTDYAAVDERIRPVLTAAQAVEGFEDLALVSPGGDVLFSMSRGKDFGTNYKTGPFRDSAAAKVFRLATSLLSTEISEFEPHPGSGGSSVYLAAPFFRSGHMIGAAVLRMNNEEISALAQDYRGLGQTGETVVGTKIGDEVLWVTPTRHDPAAAFKRTVSIVSHHDSSLVQAVLGRQGQGVMTDYRGREVLTAWRHLPSFAGGVAVKIDSQEAFAPIRRLGKNLFVIVAGTIILTVLLAFGVARSISDPIRRLHAGTEIIGKGDLDYRVGTPEQDEIGQLSRSFDEMVLNLKKVTTSRDELNREMAARALMESRQALWNEILQLLNEPLTLQEGVRRVLSAIRREMGFDAAAIRLRNGNDFPYCAQVGFPEEFLLTENTLTVSGPDGELSRGRDGVPLFACTCGLVLSGKTVQGHPLFTPGGSFWTNDASSEVNFPACADPRSHPRDRCLRDGYCSLALLPIRANREIIGLLQLNDRKKGRFTPELIRFFEGIGTSLGVTMARKMAEEERNRLAAIVESADDGIIAVTLEGIIVSWNRGAESVYGYKAREMTGKSVSILTPSERQNEIPEILSRIRRGETVRHFETERIRRGGQVIDVSQTISPVRDASGTITGASSIIRNISGRKRMEKELMQAKMTAETASRAKSEFLSNMSHELRTPLNAIIGFTEVLHDQKFGPLNETQLDYLNDVLDSGHHLLSLINDVLDLTKIESGKMELLLSTFSLKDTLRHSLTFIKERACKHGIEISLALSEEVGFIHADERKVKQILFNLLSNAVKFTPDGGKLGIRARLAGAEAEVAVWDTGVGIAQEDQERLFGEFVQLDNPLTKRYEGTGLGLSVTKKLVTLHGGRVWAESAGPGQGSVFTFRIPVKGGGEYAAGS